MRLKQPILNITLLRYISLNHIRIFVAHNWSYNNNMVTIQDLRGSKCTDIEWTEYCWMPQVRTNETPRKWKQRIWSCLQYFKENDLLPIESKKYFNARN